MSTAMTSQGNAAKNQGLVNPALVFAHSYDVKRGSATAGIDEWGTRFQQLNAIDRSHCENDYVDQPRIPASVIAGARRLIRQLADQQKWPPPTCMTGTVDATICFEWHDPAGEERFVSIDVTDSDQAEKFTQYRDGRPSQLERFTF